MRGKTLIQTAAPSVEPIVLLEAKAHLKVETTAEDALIQGWIVAARQHVEAYTGRALLPQDWEVRMDDFPWHCGFVDLPNPPLIQVLWAKAFDAAGAETLIPSTDYVVDAPGGDRCGPARLYPAGNTISPALDAYARGALRIRYRAGYASAGAVPAPLRAAMFLLIGDLFESREASQNRNMQLNPAVERLLAPYRLLVL